MKVEGKNLDELQNPQLNIPDLQQNGTVMKFEDLKIGQHLWVICSGELLMVAKFNDKRYEVCGAWECGIGKDECEIIELVDIPKGYEKTKLYYGQ